MPSGNKPPDSLELEVLGVRSESSDDDCINPKPSSSASSVAAKRKRFWHHHHHHHNNNNTTKSAGHSSRGRNDREHCGGSLYSLAALNQSNETIQQQFSEPNVYYHVDRTSLNSADHNPVGSSGSSGNRDVIVDLNLTYNQLSCDKETQPLSERTNLAESTESFAEQIGLNSHTDLPQSGGRFRASFWSVLGKLGVWQGKSGCRGKSRAPNNRDALAQHHGMPESSRRAPTKSRRSSYYFSENERRIRANDREFNAQFKYANNYIKTSKYSLLTFLPLNLLEQFQRLANFYFLCLLVLQLIPAISSLTPITTAIPLIGVLALTAVKDAYDDIQRHVSDSQVNNRKSKTFRNGKLVNEKWSGVQVGDVIRMDNNQFVAADILLLSTSEPNGLCFIETAELDGETNLKCKQCLPETAEMGQRDDLLWKFNGEIICERPNNLLNKFEGTLIWNGARFSLDNDKILLRGCILRNTQWCYGVVIFAGKDTKLMQNSGKTQFKSTSIDRLLNFIIIGIVFFLLSVCAFCTLACAIWEGLVGQYFQAYLPWESIIPNGTILGPTVIGFLVFFSYAIVLNTVVPISLYVSVEVIRFAQSFLINWDDKMYYEKTKTHAKARTTTLNEELGQIQYIFSDKTGTLTQNIMTFNKCSINGRAYGDVIDLRTGEVVEITDQRKTNRNVTSPIVRHSISDERITATSPTTTATTTTSPTTTVNTTPTTATNNSTTPTPKTTIVVSSCSGNNKKRVTYEEHILNLHHQHCKSQHINNPVLRKKSIQNQNQNQKSNSNLKQNQFQNHTNTFSCFSANTIPATTPTALISDSKNNHKKNNITTSTITNSYTTKLSNGNQQQQEVHATEPVDFSFNPEYEPEFRWYDQTLLDAVKSDQEHAHNFFRLLSLCHTVMPEYSNGRLEYQAQSPDESALVSAARNFGFVFKSRTPNSITIDVMGRTEEYELLSILDFNNVRKRMSVILKRNNKIILYCKGADNVIYDRLSSSQHDLKARTQEHLNKFAGEGLRTLVLAERHLDEEFFLAWREKQQEAALSVNGREDKLGAIYEEIECNMQLVGVTAIEDKLQDGVPQTIASLQTAGIKIWVLTGDKQETAINIGYSCQLLTDDLADVFVVDGSTFEEVEKQLRKFKESIKIINTFHPISKDHNTTTSNGANLGSSTPVQTGRNHPAPPAISVVTFSAECNQLFEGSEKNSKDNSHSNDLEDNSGFAIVINGHSLVYCLTPELENRFLDIASQCKAVICCRVTPLQKALVVELIKRAKSAVTLAIGDGANDVSMIKAAHIGVGISGQEGMQAVLASDYSIAQFRYLERLLLVHGRWSYYRMCKFLRYFFYKNFAFTLCHFWFAFFCGFSAQTVFDEMFISVYNLFYTSLPVLALGIFEQDVSDKHSLEYPKLYTPGLTNALFNTQEFIRSVLHGIFSSMVLFLIPYGTYKDGVSPDGYMLSDHMTLGSVVATILILDNTAQIALDTSYWTIFNHIMIWGSLLWYFFLDYFYNYVIGGPYVGSLTQAMKEATFWFTTVITVIVLMVPVLASRFYFFDVKPSLSDKIRLKQRAAQIRSRQSTDVLRTPSARRARRSLRSGYAFAHQEGFGRLITSGKIMRKLPQEFAFPLGLGSKNKQHHTPVEPSYKSNYHQNSTVPMPGSSNGGDISPRAPCQDLDTINL
ncbi:phospholipid-transporting ATPase ID isoform X2 [Hermetia illucens]|uniref:phospholipid-transporting ATPase ID isoform X2 n=1 Tax=Hermetia illucens TaxID=343691 RepID=UPI0018CC212B|nr:phospholipid-transporting ATPase ID isoform X2 [Hermetia illucens]